MWARNVIKSFILTVAVVNRIKDNEDEAFNINLISAIMMLPK